MSELFDRYRETPLAAAESRFNAAYAEFEALDLRLIKARAKYERVKARLAQVAKARPEDVALRNAWIQEMEGRAAEALQEKGQP